MIFLLQGIEKAGVSSRLIYPWSYAIKTVLCAALFLWLKPWKVYSALKRANILPAVLIGLLVAVIWILPETQTIGTHLPGVRDFYHRWMIMIPGSLPAYYPELPPGNIAWSYSPREAGWALTIMKLIGSSCVIAVIEEFFFRGFLYRWLSHTRFWMQPLTEFDLQPFLIMVVVFGVEHDRWLVGMVAGAIYGAFVILRGDIWAAALAHGITNFALGLYVIMTGEYAFW